MNKEQIAELEGALKKYRAEWPSDAWPFPIAISRIEDLIATAKEAERLKAERDELHAAIKTANQALFEVAHAQHNGPEWYTRGESGLRQQVAMWVQRGLEAIAKVQK
jgi:DNA repair exonuclease SbcCD ATPase subunit